MMITAKTTCLVVDIASSVLSRSPNVNLTWENLARFSIQTGEICTGMTERDR